MEKTPARAAILVAFSLIYLGTVAPGVNWGDSAKLAILSNSFELHPNAGYHSLRTVLCYPFNWIPVGDIAYRQNLSSAFFGILTLGVLFGLVRGITGSKFAGLVAVISLGFSHTFWLLSNITESYTVYTFFLSLILLQFVRFLLNHEERSLCLFGLFSGLAICVQLLIVFSLLPLGVILCYLLYRDLSSSQPGEPRLKIIIPWLKAASCFFAGLSFLVIVAIVTASKEGWGMRETLYQTLDLTHSHYMKSFFDPLLLIKNLIKRIALFNYQFPILGALLFIWGLISGVRRQRTIVLSLIFVGITNLLFTVVYLVPKWPFMMTGVYVVAAVIIGVGAHNLSITTNSSVRIKAILCALLVAFPILTYAAVGQFATDEKIHIARSVPYRDNVQYFLVPWKFNETSAMQFALDLTKTIEPEAVLISDFTASAVLDYLREVGDVQISFEIIEIGRRDIDLMEYVSSEIKQHPIYMIGGAPIYRVPELQEKFNLRDIGPSWRIEPK